MSVGRSRAEDASRPIPFPIPSSARRFRGIMRGKYTCDQGFGHTRFAPSAFLSYLQRTSGPHSTNGVAHGTVGG